jgi:hypothetical protein
MNVYGLKMKNAELKKKEKKMHMTYVPRVPSLMERGGLIF